MMIFSHNQVFWFRAAVVLVLGHWNIAAAQEELFLGALSTRAHAVSGDVYLLSSKVLEIRGFTYDGTAPAVYFWADTTASPSSRGQVLSDGFPSSGCAVAVGDPEVPPSTGVTQRVEFPGDLTIFDFVGGSLSVWCEAFAENFGSLVLPTSLDASQVPSDGPSPECSVTAEARTLQAIDGFNLVSLAGSLAGASFNYKFNAADSRAGGKDTISVIFEAPATAWVACGTSNNGGIMIGSEAVIGIPDTGEVFKYNLNDESVSAVVAMSSDKQTLIDASVTQQSGITILKYTKILEETDEILINLNSDNTFLSAWGSSNTLGVHVAEGSFAVSGEASGTPSPTPSSATPLEGSIDGFVLVPLAGSLAGASFNYKFNAADTRASGKDTISVVYEAPATGWVACGTSNNGGIMIGSEAVIGLPDTGEVFKYNLNEESVSAVVAMSSDKQTLIDASVTQQSGSTILKYTKILEETDEIKINFGQDNTFLSAWGSSNTLGVHAAEGSFLLSGEALTTAKIKLWKAHGWMAAIAWGLLSPLAIAASVLRRFFPGQDTWFTVHRALNMMAVLFTIVSFVLAVVAVNQETPPGAPADHFDDGHRLYGLIIFILAMLQAIGGAARPHLPKKPEPADAPETADAVDGESKTVPDSKSFARIFWEIGHRVIGLGILLFCWYQVQLGIKDYGEDYNDDDTGAALPVFWAVVGTMGSLIVVGYALKVVSPE